MRITRIDGPGLVGETHEQRRPLALSRPMDLDDVVREGERETGESPVEQKSKMKLVDMMPLVGVGGRVD